MPKPSPYVDLFTEALRAEPHTTAELAELAGCDERFAFAVLARMHYPTKTLPRRIYASGWVRHEMEDGTRGQFTPVWALGDKPDATKPKRLSDLSVNRYSRKKKREERQRRIETQTFKVASVFDLGALVDTTNHKWKRAA